MILLRQLGGYFAVAIVALIADLSLLLVCVEWIRLPVLLAAAIGFCGGLAVNYFLCTRLVFKSRSDLDRATELILFAGTGLIGFVITEAMLKAAVYLSVDYRLSKLAAVAVVFIWNFCSRRTLLLQRGEGEWRAEE